METETKLAIQNRRRAKQVWRSIQLEDLNWISHPEKLVMKANYYDTTDHDIEKNLLAFRLRKEGKAFVATLKGRGREEDGTHIREEVNKTIRLADNVDLLNPPVNLFKDSEFGKEVADLLKGKVLFIAVVMQFVRMKRRVRYGESTMELSVDTGKMTTIKGKAPICEMELELMEGNREDLEALTKIIAEKYQLEPESRSKIARGFALFNSEK